MNSKINYYQSKFDEIRGSNDKEVYFEARIIFNKYVNKNKRRQPYVRSKYFGGQKVFLSMFWKHLNQKSEKTRRQRIVFIKCAFDLIINSNTKPLFSDKHNGRKGEYYKFQGMTRSGKKFAVQIKRDNNQNRLFMSCYPLKKFKDT
ncbi:MAG: hypothetical protein LBK50_03110 [Candidatus Nomurabacteria bacterium]|jgi:hypothetical protein|nr:hypothetical protein [Candidatus Nomurabacteria bacterium]